LADKDVMPFNCHGLKGNQQWKFIAHANQIYHSFSDKCLAVGDDEKLVTENCKSDRIQQKWFLDHLDLSKV